MSAPNPATFPCLGVQILRRAKPTPLELLTREAQPTPFPSMSVTSFVPEVTIDEVLDWHERDPQHRTTESKVIAKCCAWLEREFGGRRCR